MDQVVVFSKLMDHAIADCVVECVVTGVVPVVEKGTKHGATHPPVVGRIEHTRITADGVNALGIVGRILCEELGRELLGDVVDRACVVVLVARRVVT